MKPAPWKCGMETKLIRGKLDCVNLDWNLTDDDGQKQHFMCRAKTSQVIQSVSPVFSLNKAAVVAVLPFTKFANARHL